MSLEIAGYELEFPIYESRRHIVCRGRRLVDSRPVIIKALRVASLAGSELATLQHEHDMLARVDSAHVPKVLAFEHERGKLAALVLEDIGARGSLAAPEILADASLAELLDVAIQACAAIDAVHRAGLIHYDIKPANFVYARAKQQVQLVDFGLAMRLTIEQPELHGGDLVGTLPYLSPEQTGRMNRPADHRSDLYSLGVVLYELFAGRHPFEANDMMGWIYNHIAVEPVPLHVRTPTLAGVLSAIVARAMAKDPEQRYQSALGLLADLRRCAQQLAATGAIEMFEPGADDVSRSFDVPAKLYGRASQLGHLIEGFMQARQGLGRTARLVLVSGPAGIGKSSLVRELRVHVTASRGMMAAGKFDQLQRGTPLLAFSELLDDLAQQLLGQSEARLAELRASLDAALGRNAGILVELAPALAAVLGPSTELVEIGGLERVNRLKLVVERFVAALAGSELPLVLFFDDLQWIDAASSMLLTHLLSSPELAGVLIVGAYRPNEIDSVHLLQHALESIQAAGVEMSTLELAALTATDLASLLADTLHRPRVELEALARLVHDKTDGNPFYVRVFLRELHREGLLRFDEDQRGWAWSGLEIAERAATKNVGELLLQRLEQLPAQTKRLVQLAGCVGNRFDLATLATVAELGPVEVLIALWPALEQGLLIAEANVLVRVNADRLRETLASARDGSGSGPEVTISDEAAASMQLRFRHDRVQTVAATSLTNAAQARLEIGRVLRRSLDAEAARARVFEIADHLNAGRALLTDPGERRELAGLDLECGRKAISAGAYRAALAYLDAAEQLLGESHGVADELAFAVALELTRALYLDGDYARARSRYLGLHTQARTVVEHLTIYGVELEHSMLAADYDAGFAACRAAFALQGIELPEHDADAGAMVGELLGAVEANLVGREIAELRNMSEVDDPAVLGLLAFLNGFGALTYLSGRWTLNAWGIAKMVNLSLVHGRSNLASFAYGYFGFFLALQGDLERARAFGELGLSLIDDYDDPTTAGRTLGAYLGLAGHYAQPLLELVPQFYRAYPLCLEAGDLMYAGYHLLWGDYHKLAAGAPLPALAVEIERHLPFFSRLAPVIRTVFYQPHVIYAYCELTGTPQSDHGLSFDSEGFLAAFAEVGIAKGWHCSALLKCDYLLGRRHALALLEQRVANVEAGVAAQHHVAEAYLYASLSLLASLRERDIRDPDARARATELIDTWRGRLARWAEACPANFGVKHALVEAELARTTERPLGETMTHYERALEQARRHASLDLEALASLRYAEFWRAYGSQRSAALYLSGAHDLYRRWGATRIVSMLEQLHPELATHANESISHSYSLSRSHSSWRSGGSSTQVALEGLTQAAEAIAGETSFSALVSKLASVLGENLGARRCLILLPDGDTWRAEGHPDTAVSDAVTNYVRRSGHRLVLDDAGRDSRWAMDPHIFARRSKSLLCAPITLQDKLIGLLYAENDLSAGVFTQELLDSARVVMAQAAITLENARLFAALVEQEQQLRQSQKMEAVGTLAGGIAHDFNNLLMVIRGAAELGQLDSPVDSENLIYFAEILQATDRAARLTRQLLTFSRKELNRPESVDLDALVGNLAKMLGRLLGADIELVVELAAKDCCVYGDPGQLEQVLVNLAVNARDAMPKGGRLVISTTREGLHPHGGEIRLSVVDMGVGMTEATRARIFDPFFTTKEAGKGTGLGLAMVHGIVTQHGGSISVSSELGVGSRFDIRLPEHRVGEALAAHAGEGPIIGGSETILLVEDDDQVRKLARKMLEGLGYQVFDEPNGELALARARELGSLDLLLTDVVIPRMSGPELAAALSKLRPGLRVLYVSGYADETLARHDLDVTRLELLSKPFTIATLAAAIRHVLASGPGPARV